MKPLPTSAELLERFRVAAEAAARPALARGQTLSWAATSRWNIIRVASVRLAERVLYLVEDRFRQSFLATATGDGLDDWQRSEAPGFPRKPASSATTRLTLTRGSTTSSGTIAAGTRFGTTPTASTPQVTFRSLADVPVSSGQATVFVDVVCEASGEIGNVISGAINRTLGALFDTFNAPTNAGPAAGGGPAEGDEPFRARLQQRDARYRRGTTQAVKFGALTVSGVSRVTLYDPMNTDGAVPDGELVVIVGDASGVGSAPMADAAKIALPEWVASGVKYDVYPASVLSIIGTPPLPSGSTQIRVEITHAKDPTFDRVATERAARSALARLFAGLQFNQALYIDQMKTAVMDLDRRIRRVRFVALPSGIEIGDIPATGSVAQRWGAPDATWLFSNWHEVT